MAIARGAGTEIIRTAMFEDIDSTTQKLIIGEKHHIYTVLSIVICAVSVQAVGNQININFQGYDSKGGTTDETTTCWSGYPTNSAGLSDDGTGDHPTHQRDIVDCHAFDGLEDGTPCVENWANLGCGCFLPPPVMYWPDVDNDGQASGEGHYYCECLRTGNACDCFEDNSCTSWDHN